MPKPKPRPPVPETGPGTTKSRCPSCQEWVLEGGSHTCRMGRDRQVFVNPVVDTE